MFPYVSLFGGQISSYTVCVFIGAILATYILKTFLFRRLLFRIYFPLILFSLVGLFVGAKLFAILSLCITDLITTGTIHFIKCIVNSGIVYLGGLLGFLCMLHSLCKVKMLELKNISKEMVISITIFHSFGRLGCFWGGCCYGCIYEGVFSIPYRIGIDEVFLPRFPTKLVESIFELILFSISLFSYKNRKGITLINYLYIYSFFRFFLEFFRGDEVRGVYGILSFSQIVCIVIVLILFIKSLKNKKQTEGE